jgi:signal transduction histidine kinase/ActR/RegA family two-component response regulator
MHLHLSAFQETGGATSLSGAFAHASSDVLPFAAELWVERCLSHLGTRLNECFNAALAQPPLRESISPQLLQMLVDHLSQALMGEIVAIVEPVTKDDPPTLFEVRYSALAKLPKTSLTSERFLERAIAQSRLKQWQTQERQSAWPLGDSSTAGWLIALASSPPVNRAEGLYGQLRSTLVKRAIAQTMQVMGQAQQVQQLQQHNHQLQTQTQELTQANRLKSEFLANTSHEIRTPLSSILGFTHLLREQGYNPGNVRHQEYLRIILSSGQHLLALINDILDLSKIEANQLDLQCETVDVLSVCQMALKLVKEKANDRGLTLKLEVADDVSTIGVDPLRLKQMLFNLLSNALKFTARGTVGLEVKVVEDELNFTVWDTGTGISEEQQQLLFRPYTQLTNAIQGEGTGLGLALTQKLAELHGGKVKVQSQLGQGSQFTIALPLVRDEKNAEEQLQSQPAMLSQVGASVQPSALKTQSAPTPQSFTPLANKRGSAIRSHNVLLVEDNVHNARLLIAYLCRLGYEVTWAKDSREMWQSLTQSLPALILMDIHLPGADGLDLTQQLQTYVDYRSIPVIVQTAMAMKGDRERCLASGAVDYISKPIDLKVLANMVAKYSAMEREK